MKYTFSRVTDLVRLKNYDSDDMKYSPGDHLCVYPSNNSKMVKELLTRCECSTNQDDVIEVQFNNGGKFKKLSNLYASLRKKCPYSELFWSAFSRI